MSTKKSSAKSGASILSKINEDQKVKKSEKPKTEKSGPSVLSKINDDPKD